MFCIREGESHTPTPKPALVFNWTGTTKRPFALYVCKEQQEQILKIYKISSCWKCDTPIGQFTLFLGIFFLMICPLPSDVSFVQKALLSLTGCLYIPGKTKYKTFTTLILGSFPYGKLYVIKHLLVLKLLNIEYNI